jgi:hypothetical protein
MPEKAWRWAVIFLLLDISIEVEQAITSWYDAAIQIFKLVLLLCAAIAFFRALTEKSNDDE